MEKTDIRVTLRNATASDAGLIASWVDDPNNRKFMPSLGDPLMSKIEHWDHFLKSDKNSHVYISETSDAKQPVGLGVLYNLDTIDESAFLGTLIPSIDGSTRGHSVATHLLLLRKAFDELSVKRVHTKVYAASAVGINRMKEGGYLEVSRKSNHKFSASHQLGDEIILRLTLQEWREIRRIQFG